MLKKPELVAPAGDWDCAKAAVENGADAVYFGLTAGFNARARAGNFAVEQLPELMTYLRRRGVKGYLTLNTLVFPEELAAFERTGRAAVAAGVDAAIVQDLGVARLLRALCADLPLHASTQMTLSSAESIRMVESLGVERVVLPRELSIAEIGAVRSETPLGLEVFVHGALCISYSGQCLASLALGGRSANRGQCAQACRLPYELVCDDERRTDCKYPLSPHDLAAWDLLPELIAAGVDAMKIEGRMKTPEYVAAVTRCYRDALDASAAGKPFRLTPEQLADIEVCFSRGFTHGWLEGGSHQRLVPGHSSAKRGVLLGKVRAVRGDRVLVELAGDVRRGDGIALEGGGDGPEQGGRVFEIFVNGRSVLESKAGQIVGLTFGRGAVDLGRLRPGVKVRKTDDPRLARRLRQTFSAGGSHRKVSLSLAVEAAAGRRLRITGEAGSGATCLVESPEPLPAAVKHPLTADVLRQQLGRLGGTCYQLDRLDAHIDCGPMVPLSVLGALRREMVRQLDDSLASPPPRALAAESPLPALRAAVADARARGRMPDQAARLHVLCRTMGHLEAVLDCRPSSVIIDFQGADQAASIAMAHAAGADALLATPRIQKPGEADGLRALAECGADGILVRSLGSLAVLRPTGLPLVADFSLNAANELTVDWLLQRGVSRVTASYDLDRRQLLDLAAAVPPGSLEVAAYAHVPMFHTEHCIFSASLSDGGSSADCGRPCDRHVVRLRDRMGVEHPVECDASCRNTVYNATARIETELAPLLERGVADFRIELLPRQDDHRQIRAIVTLYHDLLAGRLSRGEALVRLRSLEEGKTDEPTRTARKARTRRR